jgi:addiction module HigA family antidote
LEALNAASRLEDLQVPASNRLEELRGGQKDSYFIRINDRWRLIFNGRLVKLMKLKSSSNIRKSSLTKPSAEDDFAPVAPGAVLKEEFLAEYGLSQNELAKALGISPNRIAEIINSRRRITADTALRLGLYFGNRPEFWLNLQMHYDLKLARKNLKPHTLARIKQRAA